MKLKGKKENEFRESPKTNWSYQLIPNSLLLNINRKKNTIWLISKKKRWLKVEWFKMINVVGMFYHRWGIL